MTLDRDVLLRHFWRPAHGGYPGEVVVQDECLECLSCGWSYTLDSMAEGEECGECDGPLEVHRAYPVESTIRMALHV